MKQRSEDWVSLLLLCHIRSVPAEEPARDASTRKTVRDNRLTGEALTRSGERELDSRLFGKVLADTPGWRLKCTQYNVYFQPFLAFVGLISCGFTMRNILIGDSLGLDCFSCGLWTRAQHTFFPWLPLSTSSVPFIIPFILIPFTFLTFSLLLLS